MPLRVLLWAVCLSVILGFSGCRSCAPADGGQESVGERRPRKGYDHNRWITADNCRLSKDINYSSCRESCEQDETCKVWSYLSSGNLCKHCTSLHDWFSWERIPDAKSGRANSNVTSEDCQWHDVVFVPRLALTKQQEEPKRETLEACHDACRSRGTRYSWYSTEDVGHCICHDGDVEAIKFLGGVAGEYGDSGCDNNVYPEHRQPDDNGGCFMVNSTFDITDGKLCVKVACGSSLHASVGICTAKTCQKACQATPNMYEYFAYVPEGPVNNVDDDGESVCYCCKKSAQRTPAKKVLAGPRWCSGFSSDGCYTADVMYKPCTQLDEKVDDIYSCQQKCLSAHGGGCKKFTLTREGNCLLCQEEAIELVVPGAYSGLPLCPEDECNHKDVLFSGDLISTPAPYKTGLPHQCRHWCKTIIEGCHGYSWTAQDVHGTCSYHGKNALPQLNAGSVSGLLSCTEIPLLQYPKEETCQEGVVSTDSCLHQQYIVSAEQCQSTCAEAAEKDGEACTFFSFSSEKKCFHCPKVPSSLTADSADAVSGSPTCKRDECLIPHYIYYGTELLQTSQGTHTDCKNVCSQLQGSKYYSWTPLHLTGSCECYAKKGTNLFHFPGALSGELICQTRPSPPQLQPINGSCYARNMLFTDGCKRAANIENAFFCQQACASRGDCTYFSFSGEGNVCYHCEKKPATRIFDPYAVSGTATCDSDKCLSHDAMFSGDEIATARYNKGFPGDCERWCTHQVRECRQYSWIPKDISGQCRYFRGDATAAYTRSAVSGLRDCKTLKDPSVEVGDNVPYNCYAHGVQYRGDRVSEERAGVLFPGDCAAACDKLLNCQYFSWTPVDDRAHATCSFHGPQARKSSVADAVSGERGCTEEPTLPLDSDYCEEGIVFRENCRHQPQMESEAHCRQSCKNGRNTCAFFSFSAEGHCLHCLVRPVNTEHSWGAISGVPDCKRDRCMWAGYVYHGTPSWVSSFGTQETCLKRCLKLHGCKHYSWQPFEDRGVCSYYRKGDALLFPFKRGYAGEIGCAGPSAPVVVPTNGGCYNTHILYREGCSVARRVSSSYQCQKTCSSNSLGNCKFFSFSEENGTCYLCPTKPQKFEFSAYAISGHATCTRASTGVTHTSKLRRSVFQGSGTAGSLVKYQWFLQTMCQHACAQLGKTCTHFTFVSSSTIMLCKTCAGDYLPENIKRHEGAVTGPRDCSAVPLKCYNYGKIHKLDYLDTTNMNSVGFPGDCRISCDAHKSCTFFSWLPLEDASGRGICTYHGPRAIVVDKAGGVSGQRNCSTSTSHLVPERCFFYEIVFAARPIAGSATSSPSSCQKTCSINPRCELWSWYRAHIGGYCTHHTRTAIHSGFRHPYGVSGQKSCHPSLTSVQFPVPGNNGCFVANTVFTSSSCVIQKALFFHALQCQKECMEQHQLGKPCHHFSYSRIDHTCSLCSDKHADDKHLWEPSVGAYSGPRNCANDKCHFKDWNYDGYELPGPRHGLPADCQEACNKIEGCDYFSWSATRYSGFCRYHSKEAVPVKLKWGVAGPRVCSSQPAQPSVVSPFDDTSSCFALNAVYLHHSCVAKGQFAHARSCQAACDSIRDSAFSSFLPAGACIRCTSEAAALFPTLMWNAISGRRDCTTLPVTPLYSSGPNPPFLPGFPPSSALTYLGVPVYPLPLVQSPMPVLTPMYLQQSQGPSATSSVPGQWTDASWLTMPHVYNQMEWWTKSQLDTLHTEK